MSTRFRAIITLKRLDLERAVDLEGFSPSLKINGVIPST